MKNHILAFVVLLVSGTAYAESARTIRATELQAQSQSDAATLATLPENTKVSVLRRSGAWSEIKTVNGQAGWVRMLSLRFDEGASGERGAANPAGALTNLLSSGRTSGTATVTTGVRGLTEADLQRAQANPAELQKLQKFAIQKDVAQAFAQRTKLSPAQVEYLPEPAPLQQNTPAFDGG
ncbi:MAG: hypothetical protein A3I66_18485 [Burkholderiales bacterium RIFCSPLOWO2_02_FULL_57_36]|nr:MAG: hypothetical protein A3I66_18485 [Burkholderiales bacterium RIFCSPLOWO2_02_FULL_57_36]